MLTQYPIGRVPVRHFPHLILVPPRPPSEWVFCIATTDLQAEAIVHPLKLAGFSSDQISVLVEEKRAPSAIRPAGSGACGMNGGAWSWLEGGGTSTICGASRWLATGPLLEVLRVSPRGGAISGVTAALVAAGVPEYEARKYEIKLKAGSILISVKAESPHERAKARDVFERAGAQNISYTD
jgi:hypothetical protein